MSERRFPVVETFGPTIQGEGYLAGLPTFFIRFGLCDYRCEWCDSMHAVDPAQVKALAKPMTAEEIDALFQRDYVTEWVTFSGGNPAIHDLGPLVEFLHDRGLKVCVETQGSKWRPWLSRVDCLTVSPKPPSSGMATSAHEMDCTGFLIDARHAEGIVAVKIVVFDERDYEWAARVFDWLAKIDLDCQLYLSCGTDRPVEGEPFTDTMTRLTGRYKWLCETASRDPRMARVRVLPQLHVIAWGHALGV